MLRLALDDSPPGDRLEQWLDWIREYVSPFSATPCDGEAVSGEFEARLAGDTSVVSATAGGYRAARRPLEIAETRRHFYAVTVHLNGAASLSANGVERQLDPGDVFVVDTMHEFVLGMERRHRQLFVNLPQELVDTRVRNAERMSGTILRRNAPVARLIAGYAAAGFEAASALSSAAAAMFSGHLADLLAEAFDEPAGMERRGTRAARLRAIRAYIARHLTDRDLSITSVALRHQVTPRYVQMLFADEGTTFSEFTLHERLRQVHRALTDPRRDRETITAIAYAAGFGDLSHFNRAFRRLYGATPTEVRLASVGPEGPASA